MQAVVVSEHSPLQMRGIHEGKVQVDCTRHDPKKVVSISQEGS